MDTLDIPLPDEMPLPPLFPHPSGRPPLPRSPPPLPPLLAPPPMPQGQLSVLSLPEQICDPLPVSEPHISTGEPPPIPTCEPPPPMPPRPIADVLPPVPTCEPPPPFPPPREATSSPKKPAHVTLSPTPKPAHVSPFHVQPLMAPPPLPKLLMSGYSDSDSEPTSPAQGLQPVSPPQDVEDEIKGVSPPEMPENSRLVSDIEMDEVEDDDSRYSPSRVTEDPLEDESVSSDIETLLFESIKKAPSPVPPPTIKHTSRPVHPLLGKDQAKKRLVAFAMTKQGGGSGLSFGFIKSNKKSSAGSEAITDAEQAKFDAKMEKPPKPNKREHRNNIEEIMQYELNLKAQLEKQNAGQVEVEKHSKMETEEFRRSRSRSRNRRHSDRKEEQETKEPAEVIDRKKDELPESWSDMKYYNIDFEELRRIKKVLRESERRRRRRSRSRSRDRKRSRDHSRRSKSPPMPFKRAKLLHSLLARSKDDLAKEYREYPGNMVRHTKCEPSVTFCENPDYMPAYYKKRQIVFEEETKEIQEIMDDIIHCRIQVAGRADGNQTAGRWYEEPHCFLMESTEKVDNNASVIMDSINGVDNSVMNSNVKEAVKSKWDSDNEVDDLKQPIKSLATYVEEEEETSSSHQQQQDDVPEESNPGEGEMENHSNPGRDSPMQNPSPERSLPADGRYDLFSTDYQDDENGREVSQERSRMSRSSSRNSFSRNTSALMDTSHDASRHSIEQEVTQSMLEVPQIQDPTKKSKAKNKKKKAKSRKTAPSDSEDNNTSDSDEGVKKKKKKVKKVKKVKKSKKKVKPKKKKRKRSHSDTSDISEDESEPQKKKRKKENKKKKKHYKEISSDSDTSNDESEIEVIKSKKKKKNSERVRSPSPIPKKKNKKKKDKDVDSGKRKRKRSHSSNKKRRRFDATSDEENDTKKKKKKKHKKADDSQVKKLKRKKEKKKKRGKRKESDDELKEVSEEEDFQLVKDASCSEDANVSIVTSTDEHFLEKTPLEEEENIAENKQLSPVDILISSSPEQIRTPELHRGRWDNKETIHWDKVTENKWQSDMEQSPESFEEAAKNFPPMPVACPVPPPPTDTFTKCTLKTVPDMAIATSTSNLMAEDLYSPTRALEESSEYSSPERQQSKVSDLPDELPSNIKEHDGLKELGGFINRLLNTPHEESQQVSEGKWSINDKGVFIQEEAAQESDNNLSKEEIKVVPKDSTIPVKAKPIGMKISLTSTSKLKPVGRPAVFDEDDDDSPDFPPTRLSSLHPPENVQPIPETQEVQEETEKSLENVVETVTTEESYNLEAMNQPEDPYIDEMLEEPVNKMPKTGESSQECSSNKAEIPDSQCVKERSKSPSKNKDQRSRSRSGDRSRHREHRSKERRASRERKDRRRSSSRSRRYRSRSRSRSPRRRYRGRSRSRSRDRRRDRRSPARRRRSRSIERRRRRYSRSPSPHKRTRRSRSRTRKTKSPYRHSERSSSYDRRSYNPSSGQPITLTIDDSVESQSQEKDNFNIPIDDIPLPDSDAKAVKKRLADSTINDLDLVDSRSGDNFWQEGAASKIQWYQMPGAQQIGPESNYLRVGNLLEVVPAAGSKEKEQEESNKQEWVQQGNLLTVVPSQEGDKARSGGTEDKPSETVVSTGIPKIKLPIPDPSKAKNNVDVAEGSQTSSTATETLPPAVTKSQSEVPCSVSEVITASKAQPEAAKAVSSSTSKAALDMLNKLYGQSGVAGQSVSSQKALEMMSSLLSSISKKSTANPTLPPPSTMYSTAKAEPVGTSKETTHVPVETKIPVSVSSTPVPAAPTTPTTAKPTSVPTQSTNAIQVLIDHLTKMTQAPKASPPPVPKPSPPPVPKPQPVVIPPRPKPPPPPKVVSQPVLPKPPPQPPTLKPTPQPTTPKPALTAAGLSTLIQQLSTSSQSLSPKAMQLLQKISKMLPQQNISSKKGPIPSQKHTPEKEKVAFTETSGQDRPGLEKLIGMPVTETSGVVEPSAKAEAHVKSCAEKDDSESITPLSEHKETLEQRLERESMKQILDKITRSADTQEENARASAIEKQEQKHKEREERRLRKLEKKKRKLKIANTDDLPPPPPPESPPPVVFSSRKFASPPPLSDALDIEDQILMREAMEVDVENEGITPSPQVLPPSPDEISEHIKKKKKKKKKSRESESSSLTFRLPLPPKGILVSTGFRDKLFGPSTKVVMFADGVKPGEGASPDTREGMHSPPPPVRLHNKQKKKIRVTRIEGEDDDDDDGIPPPPPESPPPSQQFGPVQFQPAFVHPAALQQAVLAAGYQVTGPTGVPVTNYVQFGMAPMQMMLRGASQTDPRYRQQL